MGKLVSETDYQDILGNQQKEYERVEFISNEIPIIINTDIYTTESTRFEIKLAICKSTDFSMGSFDFTDGRKIAKFRMSKYHITYFFPDDIHSFVSCNWNDTKPSDYKGDFPHIIEFGNLYINDITTNPQGRLNPQIISHYFQKSKVSSFKTKAPFGLFGIIEYKGEDLSLGYIIPQNEFYKIYYFKAYEKDQQIAEMIPVKDDAGTLCMYDLIRKRFYYTMDETGKISNPKASKRNEVVSIKRHKILTSFLGKSFENIKYFVKREWAPKYIGGRLDIIQHGRKYRVVAYSKTDDDSIVVWDRSDNVVRSARWSGATIVLCIGVTDYHFYGPHNNDY